MLDVLGAYQFNFNAPDQEDVVPLAQLVQGGHMAAAQIAVQKGAVVDRCAGVTPSAAPHTRWRAGYTLEKKERKIAGF